MSNTGDQTRRDALARTLCARLCDARRDAAELGRFDAILSALDRSRDGDSLRVYIAASSAELIRVHATMEVLRANGVEAVSSWPEVVANTPGGANPLDASKEERGGWSSQDLFEVVSCDVLLLLVPRVGATFGGGFEAGAAWSHGLHLIFAGPTKKSIFCATGEEFEHDSEAIAAVVEMARRRA